MTSEIIEAPSARSAENGQHSMSFHALDLLKERLNFPPLAQPLCTPDYEPNSAYIIMKDPYGNGGVARPDEPRRLGYGNGDVARPNDPRINDSSVLLDDKDTSGQILQPGDDDGVIPSDGAGSGGHEGHPGDHNVGGAGGHSAGHHRGTDTGAFDNKLQTVDVPGLTDENRADAMALGHAVLNGTEDDVRTIMEKYSTDRESMTKMVEALNQGFDGNGLKFSINESMENSLTISATPLHAQMLNAEPSITVVAGNRAETGETIENDAARWRMIQVTMSGNMERNLLDIPPLDQGAPSPNK